LIALKIVQKLQKDEAAFDLLAEKKISGNLLLAMVGSVR
jgi:hypothetical protein